MNGYIHIEPKHAGALYRALDRAHVAGIDSDPALHYTVPYMIESIDTLMVSSSTEPGHRHEVTVGVRGREVWTRCECRAGSTGTICQHVALALFLMGFERALILTPLSAVNRVAVAA